MLHQKIANRMCGFEFQREYATRREDAEQHLDAVTTGYPMLSLLDAPSSPVSLAVVSGFRVTIMPPLERV
jgi:hypothetical protein